MFFSRFSRLRAKISYLRAGGATFFLVNFAG